MDYSKQNAKVHRQEGKIHREFSLSSLFELHEQYQKFQYTETLIYQSW